MIGKNIIQLLDMNCSAVWEMMIGVSALIKCEPDVDPGVQEQMEVVDVFRCLNFVVNEKTAVRYPAACFEGLKGQK